MRKMVILAVLFASLLVVTSVAFAVDCCEDYCYKVTGRDLTNPANSFTQHWSFCGDGDDNAIVCNEVGPIYLFEANFVNTRVITFDSMDYGAYMTFHENWTSFDGLYYNGDQFTIHGTSEGCAE